MASRKQIRIAVMAVNNIEDVELFVPLDLWKRAGFFVDVIVCEQRNGFVLAYSGLKVTGNNHLHKVNFSMYDAIFLPGGSGYKGFLVPPANAKVYGESKLNDAIRSFADNKTKWLIGICASPLVYFSVINDNMTLSEAKVDVDKFNQRKFTAYNDPELLGEYHDRWVNNWVNERVVVDSNLITAQAAGNAFELAFTVIEKLGSAQLALEVAEKINYPWNLVKPTLNVKFA